MKKILPLIIVGILVLSGFGVAAVTSSKATMDNHPPDAPFIDGEKGVIIGVEFDYYFNATDPDGDNVSYYIDWGDTNAEETAFHASGEEVAVSHTYDFTGDIVISARAKDIHGLVGPEGCYIPEWKWRNNKQSAQQSSTGSSISQNTMCSISSAENIEDNVELWDALSNIENDPPNTPEIYGPTTFEIGVEYVFYFVTTDPNGDNVSYYIDWDDGTNDLFGPIISGEEIATTHAFYEKRDYLIEAKAIDHPYGAESDWGYLLLRWKSKNRIINNTIFMNFLEQFPILNRLLYLINC